MKKSVVLTIIIIILLIAFALVFDWGRRAPQDLEIDNNQMAREVLYNSTSDVEMPIVVNNIKDNQQVSNPINISGKARGNWFFEASFPIQLVDAEGNILGTTVAQAEGDWMTTDFVNFTASLEYNKSTSTNRALLILSKDNPSDNPEFDQSIFIPIVLN